MLSDIQWGNDVSRDFLDKLQTDKTCKIYIIRLTDLVRLTESTLSEREENVIRADSMY